MMDYNPVNFRRLDWFNYTPNVAYGWREGAVDDQQAALTRNAYTGNLPRTDYYEPRSYLSYFLE